MYWPLSDKSCLTQLRTAENTSSSEEMFNCWFDIKSSTYAPRIIELNSPRIIMGGSYYLLYRQQQELLGVDHLLEVLEGEAVGFLVELLARVRV